MIKRLDGRDDFKVTNATVLCEEHFAIEDVKRYPNLWRLVAGAAPSQNLFQGCTATVKPKSCKPPLNRSPQVPHASACAGPSASVAESANLDSLPDTLDNIISFSGGNLVSVSTQTEFFFISSAVYLPSDSGAANNEIINAFLEADKLMLEAQELISKISSLGNQVTLLKTQITELKKSLFSIEKFRVDETATRFYTGFPNFSTLLATFEYFEPKLSKMHYWRGKQSTSTSDLSYHGKSILKPAPKRFLLSSCRFTCI